MHRLMSRWRHPLPWLLALVGYSLWQQADGWLGLLDGQSCGRWATFSPPAGHPAWIRTFWP